ncbi:type II toxin-antitoxin system VapC family toxin [Deinococcus rubellus]|uniref:PIN domain-containing protein n=1 Tax=Deinococcus rubellus TaxID=1889240 RepID=UPI0031E766A4
MADDRPKRPPEVLLDANVLLRYLTGDPAPMADRARVLLERAEGGELVLVLTPLILAECVWVLKSFYKQPLAAIADALQQVLALDGLRIQDVTLVTDALITMARANVDFADAYLAELGKAGGLKMATFDQDFRQLGGETLEF